MPQRTSGLPRGDIQDDAGGDGHEQVLIAVVVADPVITTWRLAQMAHAVVVHDDDPTVVAMTALPAACMRRRAAVVAAVVVPVAAIVVAIVAIVALVIAAVLPRRATTRRVQGERRRDRTQGGVCRKPVCRTISRFVSPVNAWRCRR